MDDEGPLVLCVLLWPHPGREHELAGYEDQVLPLLADHGGRVRERLRARSDADPDGPVEVQVIELPGDAALDAYLADPRRTALTDLRDRAIARTELHRLRSGSPASTT